MQGKYCSVLMSRGEGRVMSFWILIALMIGSCIWWYTDLYDIIINFSNKVIVKTRLITMCISTIVTIILLLVIIVSIFNH
jgi:hypothetical protein